jgi:hypothetical protein
MAAVLCKFLRTQDFPTWIKIAAHEAMATWRLTAWRKAISDITTFLRTDRIARDRLFRSVEHAVKRRSWLAAFDANARFESALNQHLLMEEEVLVRALEQYSGNSTMQCRVVSG